MCCTQVRVRNLMLNLNKANSVEAERKKQEIVCRDLHCGEILQLHKKVPPDGNKLAGGGGTEPESLKTDPASKWLNLAFVGARNQSRSLPDNLPQ